MRCEKCDIPLTSDSRTCPQCGRYVNVEAPVQRVGKPAAPVYRAARPPAPNPEPPKHQRTIDVRAVPSKPKPMGRTHTVLKGPAPWPFPAPPTKVLPAQQGKPKSPGLNLPKGVTKVWIELRVEMRLVRGENESAASRQTDAVLALACSKDGRKVHVAAQSARFPLIGPSVPTPEASKALEWLRALAVKHGLVEQSLPNGANWFSYRYNVPERKMR